IQQAKAHEAGDYITATPISSRLIAIPKRFLLGETGAPAAAALFGFVLVILVVAAAWLFVGRVDRNARRHALSLFALALVATVLPFCLALVGLDFFAYR